MSDLSSLLAILGRAQRSKVTNFADIAIALNDAGLRAPRGGLWSGPQVRLQAGLDTKANRGPPPERKGSPFERMRLNDLLIIEALKTGRILVDADAGKVFSGSRGGIELGQPRGGYIKVGLRNGGKNGRVTYVAAHRVIWIAVHGPIPNGLIVDHDDNNKHNNKIGNLQLLTPIKNTNKAKADGLFKYDVAPLTKLKFVERIQLVAEFDAGATAYALHKKYGISYGRAKSIVRDPIYRRPELYYERFHPV